MGDRCKKQSLGRPQLFAALLGLCASGAHAGAQPEYCETRGWMAPQQFPAGSDLEPSDYEWTVASTKQRPADDLRSVDSKREMKAVRQAIWVVRFSFDAMTNERLRSEPLDERDARQLKYSTAEGHRRGMEFRTVYSRKMAPYYCLHNWNLVTDDRLEVDVLRRPDRLNPWSDLIRMRFVRRERQWLFDEVEWLNQRIEAAAAPAAAR